MKLNNKKIVLSVLLLGAFSGCSLLISDSMIKGIHQKMDTNHDGYIDYSEYLADSNSNMEDVKSEAKDREMSVEEYQKWDFNRADANRDGKITPQELIDLARREL